MIDRLIDDDLCEKKLDSEVRKLVLSPASREDLSDIFTLGLCNCGIGTLKRGSENGKKRR